MWENHPYLHNQNSLCRRNFSLFNLKGRDIKRWEFLIYKCFLISNFTNAFIAVLIFELFFSLNYFELFLNKSKIFKFEISLFVGKRIQFVNTFHTNVTGKKKKKKEKKKKKRLRDSVNDVCLKKALLLLSECYVCTKSSLCDIRRLVDSLCFSFVDTTHWNGRPQLQKCKHKRSIWMDNKFRILFQSCPTERGRCPTPEYLFGAGCLQIKVFSFLVYFHFHFIGGQASRN